MSKADIERLAAVARRAAGFDPVTDMALDNGLGAVVTMDWEAVVRAVLAEMREPTRSQYDALSGLDGQWRDFNSTIVWQTYIDALLKP